MSLVLTVSSNVIEATTFDVVSGRAIDCKNPKSLYIAALNISEVFLILTHFLPVGIQAIREGIVPQ